MTHPLTDEMIQSIWDKVGNDIVNSTDEELAEIIDPWDDLMRTAYDLAIDRMSQWLEENAYEYVAYDDFYGCQINISQMITDFKNAMRPLHPIREEDN